MKRRLRKRSVRKEENPGKYDLPEIRSRNCLKEEGLDPPCPVLLQNESQGRSRVVVG